MGWNWFRQPPALPCRLRHSTIGRPGLNRRVRDGYGCAPRARRHRKFLPRLPAGFRPRQTNSNAAPTSPLRPCRFPRKEVIQPHLPVRLPCYDFTPVTGPALGGSPLRWATDFGRSRLPWCDGRCVQDPGTYSPRRSDPRLLAIPASCSRVAGCNPNWGGVFGVRSASLPRIPLSPPL